MLRRKVLFGLAVLTLIAQGFIETRLAQAQSSVFTALDPTIDIPIPPTAVPQPCTGEDVIIQGTAHLRMHSAPTGQTSTCLLLPTIHTYTYFTMKDTHAVGVVSGKRYVTMDEAFDEEDVCGIPFEKTQHEVTHYIRLGEDGALLTGDDFYEHVYIHITVNANGIPTADHFDFTSECR
jgi:hypothetical protein